MEVMFLFNIFTSTSLVKNNKLLKLPAIFRLVAVCERKQNNGSLEGIDALLGEIIYYLFCSVYSGLSLRRTL